jgi:hypothetical protein
MVRFLQTLAAKQSGSRQVILISMIVSEQRSSEHFASFERMSIKVTSRSGRPGNTAHCLKLRCYFVPKGAPRLLIRGGFGGGRGLANSLRERLVCAAMRKACLPVGLNTQPISNISTPAVTAKPQSFSLGLHSYDFRRHVEDRSGFRR